MSDNATSYFHMKRKIVTRLKYNTQWEEDPILKGWVSASEKGDTFAFCKACSSHLAIGCTGRSDLEKHSKSKKHINNMQYLREDMPSRSCLDGKNEPLAYSVKIKKEPSEAEDSLEGYENENMISEKNDYQHMKFLDETKNSETFKKSSLSLKNTATLYVNCQKYNEDWENEELFCEWISRSENSENLAHCKACKRDLTISRGRRNLVKHAKSNRHLDMLNTFQSEYDHASPSDVSEDGELSRNERFELSALHNDTIGLSLEDLSRDYQLLEGEFRGNTNANEEQVRTDDPEETEMLTHHVISLMLDELLFYKEDLNLKYIKKDVFKKLAVKMAEKGYCFTAQQLIDMWTTLLDRYRAIRKEKMTETERNGKKYYTKLKNLLCKSQTSVTENSKPAVLPSRPSSSTSYSTSKRPTVNNSGNASVTSVTKVVNKSIKLGVKRTISVDKNSNNIKRQKVDPPLSDHNLSKVLGNISSKLDKLNSNLEHLVNCFAGVPSLVDKVNELIDMAQERF